MFNFLAITEEREICSVIYICIPIIYIPICQTMHGEAPICLYAYTVTSCLFDDVDNSKGQYFEFNNSKGQYFELCHYFRKTSDLVLKVSHQPSLCFFFIESCCVLITVRFIITANCITTLLMMLYTPSLLLSLFYSFKHTKSNKECRAGYSFY